ncbi:MAG: rhodanese-like domain-containing protein [Myxococcota bacterium]
MRSRTHAVVFVAAAAFLTACPRTPDRNWQETKQWVRDDFPEALQLSVPNFASMLEDESTDPLIVDVRDPREYAVSHLPGAVNAQGAALDRLVDDADKDQPIVLYCSVGYRSSREAQRLKASGYGNVANLEGSIFEWANENRPLVRGGPNSQTPTDAVHPFNDEWGTLLDEKRRSYVPR